MTIEMFEEGTGAVHLLSLEPNQTIIEGVKVKAVFEQFAGDGCSAWYSTYCTTAAVILTARAELPVLEPCIALRFP